MFAASLPNIVMAALPPPAQIAGPNIGVYEALFKQADLSGSGHVAAPEAAAFLKKSALPQTVLSQAVPINEDKIPLQTSAKILIKQEAYLEDGILSMIWDLADSRSLGYLDRDTFFVALKLISLAQANQEVSLGNLLLQTGPPSMGTASPVMVGINDNWTISAVERAKYDQIFEGLGPVNGILSGDKVKPVLVNSKLPVDVLSRVWDLSDIDGDGYLDRPEFAVAMHLVYKALEKEPVPMKLPPGLIPPGKPRKGSVIAGAVPVLPSLVSAGPGSGRNSPAMASPARKGSVSIPTATAWVITPMEQLKYDEIFHQNDLDKDGLLSGVEIKNIFLQSGVPQAVLAHIWNLCDTKGMGKLNPEQFALAMYLIQNKLKGIEPPATLPQEMIPPSARTGAAFPFPDIAGGVGGTGYETSSKELEMISLEIEELKREKMQLEKDKAQRAADIRIRNGEVAGLQKEVDAINATFKQLETQRGEAQKKLDELDVKKDKLGNSVEGLKEKCDEEEKQIANLKSTISNQEAYMKNQETELNQKQIELSDLRQEETDLEQKVLSSQEQLNKFNKNLSDILAQVDQVKLRMQQLQESQVTLETHMNQYDALISGQDGAVEPAAFTLSSTSTQDGISSVRATAGSSPPSTFSSISGGGDDTKDDLFKGHDPFGRGVSVEAGDPFQNDDPFKDAQPDDPFKGSDPFQNESFGGDPFGNDPFAGGFDSSQNTADSSFGANNNNDPFAGPNNFDSMFNNKNNSTMKDVDPFEAAFSAGQKAAGTSAKNDPFAPSGGMVDLTSPHMPPGADPFGADPFVMSPGKGKKSPAPAIPPSKQKKAPPPPRPPAPKKSPRPSPIPSDPFVGSDPFGNSETTNNGGDSFANFAEFSPSKFSSDSAFGANELAFPAQPLVSSKSPAPAPVKETFRGPVDSEAAQLAWATRQSQEAEWERQRRLKEQEEADLELALALSRQENTSEA